MNYSFKINDFEGPLDLLLHLIKKSQMDILNIEIVSLTNQYLDFINNMNEKNITVASEYLILASELIYLKSKCLLPNEKIEEDEEYIDAKEKLVSRLLEYEEYKKVSKTFQKLEEKRQEIYTKVPSNLKQYQEKIKLDENVSLEDLVKAFQKYLERKKYMEPLTTKITTKEITVDEREKTIRKILRERKKVEFIELFSNFSRKYVVVTFLAILEMAKNKEVIITQENNFDKIYCEVV